MATTHTIPSVSDRIAAFGRAITAKEAASVLGVSAQLIRREARLGNIPSRRISTSVLFDPRDLIQWWERG